ncbi:MAG TPA: hypothetical protein VFI94_12080 [Pseudolabrys sp.]|nr:hypothetical protein [Pseudolabrys sp.]
MPAILYGIGAFALFAGLVMIGFGIPINEFSFGNTLISAGTTAVVGGLILFGLGIVAGQLRRVAEALAAGPPAGLVQPGLVQPGLQSGLVQPNDALENTDSSPAAPSQGRMAFPMRPKPEPHPAELGAVSPASVGMPFDAKEAESLAPTLRNPDRETAAIEDEIALSLHQSLAPAVQPGADLGGLGRQSAPPAPGGGGSGIAAKNRDAGWRSAAPSTPAPAPASPPARSFPNANFDAMWPAEAKLQKGPVAGEPAADAKPGAPFRETSPPPPKRAESEKPRAVAILKSGIVDGMGYTLYVDGSIEAELPQGTLRFASINELRSHIAKNS